MSEVDWSKAPAWADRVVVSVLEAGVYAWAGVGIYQYFDHDKETFKFSDSSIEFGLISTRPDAWQEGEKRMDNIGPNGNDGEHYEEVQDFTKQPRYKDEDGLDWIDEFAANNSIEDFRAAMRFTIGKYERRLGKKDKLSKELYKISDYYARWSKVEKELDK